MLKCTTFICHIVFVCALLTLSSLAYAAGSVSVVPAGNNTFNVVANGLNGPAAYDITLSYDNTKLRNPQVKQGTATTGAFFVPNTNVPGQIHFAVANHTALPGSGIVATIVFGERTGDSTGPVTIMYGKVIGVAANLSTIDLHPAFIGYTPSETVAQQQDGAGGGGGSSSETTTPIVTNPGTSGTSGTSSGSSVPFVVGGTLTMPGDESAARKETAPVGQQPGQTQPGQPEAHETPAPMPTPAPSESSAAAETQPAAKKAPGYTPRKVQSVLEKFRLFTGDRTPKALTALFEPEAGAPFTQTPRILIANGKATVKVLVTKVTTERAPSFTFSHAAFVSVKEAGDGDWLVECRPEKGAVRATVTMLADGIQQDIPLTVAPPVDLDLDKSGSVTEADFQLFLKSRGTEAAPKFDLNRDGKRDYQDDYIFTANYLAAKGAKAGKETAPATKKQQ